MEIEFFSDDKGKIYAVEMDSCPRVGEGLLFHSDIGLPAQRVTSVAYRIKGKLQVVATVYCEPLTD